MTRADQTTLEQAKTLADVKALEQAAKPGWKTTEFWVTIATGIGVVANEAAAGLPPEWSVTILAGLAIVYKLARAVVKIAGAFAATKPTKP